MYWSLENVPWTNLHDLNLDWIVNTMKQTVEQWIAYRLEMDGKFADFTEQINTDFDDFTTQINSDFSDFTTQINTWKTLIETEFADLQTYVQNYFDNLDLNESTRYVINQMIASGEFIQVLNPSIVSATEAWLTSHITPTTPAVDDTLTISGAAADAKVTGEKINKCFQFRTKIPSNETSLANYVTIGEYYWSPGPVSVTDFPTAYGNNVGFTLIVLDFDGVPTGFVLQHGIDANLMNYYRLVNKSDHSIYRPSAIASEIDVNGWYTEIPNSFIRNIDNNGYIYRRALTSTDAHLYNLTTPGGYYLSPGSPSLVDDYPIAWNNIGGANISVINFDGYDYGFVLQIFVDIKYTHSYRLIKKDDHSVYRAQSIINDLDANGWYTVPTVKDYKALTSDINLLDIYNHAVVKNLLNPYTAIRGGYYNDNGVWTPSSALYSSDFIPCEAGDIISLNYAQNVVVWDLDKKYITRIGSLTNPGKRMYIKIPDNMTNVRYLTVYGYIDTINTDAVFRFPSYLGNAYSFPYNEDYTINNTAINKLIIAFGDSRTWYDGKEFTPETLAPGATCIGYLTYIRRYLTCAVQNEGVSGYTTPQISTKIKNTTIDNGDIILIAGGINDFLHSVPIGSIAPIGGTFVTSTVYGALQSAIEHILSTKPDVKLMLINPFTGWLSGDNEFPDSYAEVKRQVAKLYNLPLLDLTDTCGFNILNRSAFYADDPEQVSYFLHLNNKGNELIGRMVAKFVDCGF